MTLQPILCVHNLMHKSLLLLAISLLSLPILYWVFNNQFNFSFSGPNVKGSNIASMEGKNGVLVSIRSNGISWELVEYLCVTREECVADLNSGTHFGTVGGGGSEAATHDFFIEYSRQFDNYSFLKIYLKPGWLNSSMRFLVDEIGTIEGSELVTFENNNSEFDAIIIPLDAIKNSVVKSANFVIEQ